MYRDVSKDKRFLEVQRLLRELEKEYNLPKKSIVGFSEEIPVSIFVPELGPLEAVVKFLRESRNLSITSIAGLINRSKQGIWQAYNEGKRYPRQFLAESQYSIPISLLAGKLSVLEAAVKHLKDHCNITFAEIARLLSRDQRTVWTVYQRSRKK